ncbi:MAG: PASTA domain-containing protein [Acidimicrobiales bacterium]
MAVILTVAVGSGAFAWIASGRDSRNVDVISDTRRPPPSGVVSEQTTAATPDPPTSAVTGVPAEWTMPDEYDPSAGPLGSPTACSQPADPPDETMWTPFPSEPVTLPDLTGQDYRSAVETARMQWPHQRVLLALTPRTDVPEGRVVASHPEPGTVLTEKTIVVLDVALDPATPRTLMSSRLPGPIVSVGVLTSLDEMAPVTFLNGEVVGCSVGGYGLVWIDQLFALSEPIIVMPSVVGLNVSEADELLRSLGLAELSATSCTTPSNLAGEPPPSFLDGLILGQQPEAGEPVVRGSTIDLTLDCDIGRVREGSVLFSFEHPGTGVLPFMSGDEVDIVVSRGDSEMMIRAVLVAIDQRRIWSPWRCPPMKQRSSPLPARPGSESACRESSAAQTRRSMAWRSTTLHTATS